MIISFYSITSKNSTPEPENEKKEEVEVIEDYEEPVPIEPPSATVTSTIGIALPTGNEPKYSKAGRNKNNRAETTVTAAESKKNKKNKKEKPLDMDDLPASICGTMTTTISTKPITSVPDNNNKVKRRKDVNAKSATSGRYYFCYCLVYCSLCNSCCK